MSSLSPGPKLAISPEVLVFSQQLKVWKVESQACHEEQLSTYTIPNGTWHVLQHILPTSPLIFSIFTATLNNNTF